MYTSHDALLQFMTSPSANTLCTTLPEYTLKIHYGNVQFFLIQKTFIFF